MHEILTLQFGQRANHLATHFWNTQESYQTFDSTPSEVDHDVLFRPGIGADGTDTFLPRTVIYDLKGSFGSLRKINELYEIEGGVKGVWDGPQILQTTSTINPSPYIASLSSVLTPVRPTTDTVRFFSDFAHTYYHPRSIVQLNDFTLGSSLHPFEHYGSGDELFNLLDKEHDLLDRDLRLWAEECDQMQGLQVMTSADDAWAAFAARYLERIRDEYGKVGIWVWGIEGGPSEDRKEKQAMKTTNAARALHDISTQASMYIPISSTFSSLPAYVHMNRNSLWHTSALLSSAVESVTLPTRLQVQGRQRTTLDQLEAALNVNGNQKIGRLQFKIVDPWDLEHPEKQNTPAEQQDERLQHEDAKKIVHNEDTFSDDNVSADLDIDLFPPDVEATARRSRASEKIPHVFGQVDCDRTPAKSAVGEREEDGDDDGFARKRRRIAGLPVLKRSRTTLLFPLLPTFPSMFPAISSHSDSISVRTSVSTNTGISSHVKSLQAVVGRMAGLEEREALSNGLGEIGEAYEEGWEGGSDDESDD